MNTSYSLFHASCGVNGDKESINLRLHSAPDGRNPLIGV